MIPLLHHRRIAGISSVLLLVLSANSAHAQQPKRKVPLESAYLCIPGAQVECACLGGARGIQVCMPDGKSYDSCTGCSAGTDSLKPPAPAITPSTPSSASPPPTSLSFTIRPGMLRAGTVLTALGTAGVAVGVGLTATGLKHNYLCFENYSNPDDGCGQLVSVDDEGLKTAGGISLAVSGHLFVLGLFLVGFGVTSKAPVANGATFVPLGSFINTGMQFGVGKLGPGLLF